MSQNSRSAGTIPFRLFENLPSEKNPRTGGSRLRTMRFDLNALADFEQEVGMGFGQLMSSKALFATARGLVWAGLRHEDRLITVAGAGAKVQEFISEGGSLNDLLTEVFEIAKKQGAFGKDADEPEYAEKLAIDDGNTLQGEAQAVSSTSTVPAPAQSEDQ